MARTGEGVRPADAQGRTGIGGTLGRSGQAGGELGKDGLAVLDDGVGAGAARLGEAGLRPGAVVA